jgi:hypothetical protein
MADIFISYSKPDRDLIVKLSAFLEAEGWSVWWDKGLVPGDAYRDEIMKQLAAARAVITVWTENSVKSEWVRAEAGRAKADGKLVPTKTPSLSYADIPLPFGEMHTENVNSFELVRAAVVAQLAKPAVAPTPFRVAAKNVQFQLLTWIGIAGGAVTLFSNIGGALTLADWARLLVERWHEFMTDFWRLLLGWTGISIPKEIVPILSFAVFVAILVVGLNLSTRVNNAGSNHQPISIRQGIELSLIGIMLSVIAASGLFAFMIAFDELLPDTIAVSVAIFFVYIFPLGFVLYVSKNRTLVFVAWIFFVIVSVILLAQLAVNTANATRLRETAARALIEATSRQVVATSEMRAGVNDPRVATQAEAVERARAAMKLTDTAYQFALLATAAGLAIFLLSQFVCILLTPTGGLVKRLGFLLIGLVVLIGLSEISKLNLRQYLDPKRMSEMTN